MTLLEAGEKSGVGMPCGCRMGICHTGTITMNSGRIRDLRSGEEHFEPNESIQTWVTSPAVTASSTSSAVTTNVHRVRRL